MPPCPHRFLLIVLLGALFATSCAGPTPEAVHDHDDAEAVLDGDGLLASYSEKDGWLVSPALEAPSGATRVALRLDLVDESIVNVPRMEALGVGPDGTEGAWIPIEEVWREGELVVLRADLELVAFAARIRVRGDEAERVLHLAWSALTPDEEGDDAAPMDVDVERPASAEQALDSRLSAAGVRNRAAWGARSTRCRSSDGAKTRIAVHHTVTPPSYAGSYERRLRQIQSFHMDGRGWCDVGYHFLVTLDGRVWEGRPLKLVGAHVSGHNTGNAGVSFVGCFQPGACGGQGPTTPPAAMVAGGGRAIGAIARMFGIPLDAQRVKGHRDHSGQSTSCPGNSLHARLGTLRSYAAGIGALPAVPAPVSTVPVPTAAQLRSVASPVAKTPDGRLEVFAVGTNDRVYHKWQLPGGGWSSWTSMGGIATSEAAVGTTADGRRVVFVRGTDGALWHRWQRHDNSWAGWSSLGGLITSSPAVGNTADGRLVVFARGGNGALYHKWQLHTGGWSGWSSLGGVIAGTPTIVNTGDGRLAVFAVGGGKRVYHKWQLQGGGWSSWMNLEGMTDYPVAAARNDDGRMEIFVRGLDGALYRKRHLPGGVWTSSWQRLGGVITTAPVVARDNAGRLVVFARGSNGAGYRISHVEPGGDFGLWQSLGGQVTSAVRTATTSDGRLVAFARGTDGALHHAWQTANGGSFSGWLSLGGGIKHF